MKLDGKKILKLLDRELIFLYQEIKQDNKWALGVDYISYIETRIHAVEDIKRKINSGKCTIEETK